LPGTRKTPIAKKLAPIVNAVVLSTDKIRKEIIPNRLIAEKKEN